MSLAATLETFIKSQLNSLPNTVRKNMEEIHRLDNQCQGLTHDVQKRMRQLASKSAAANTAANREQRRKLHDSLKKDFERLRQFSDEKIRLAEKTYETVDKCIIQLDDSTHKFTSNVRKKLAVAQAQAHAHAHTAAAGPSTSSGGGKGRKRGHNATAKEMAAAKGKGKLAKRGAGQKSTMAAAATPAALTNVRAVLPLQDMPVDPNEPRYCSCNQVSFGEMVMCDNKDCPIEWFHFQCVGLGTKPKGKWYCEGCAKAMRGKGGAGRKRAHSVGGGRKKP